MSGFDRIEDEREFAEALAFEEYVEAARARRTRPCPACGLMMDFNAICCPDCIEEWE